MNTILFVSFAIFVSFIFAGIYVFSINSRSGIHRTFLLMFILLAISICSGIILNLTGDLSVCRICVQVGLSAEFFLFPTILLFCLLFTDILKIRPSTLIIIYAVPLFFFILNTSGYAVFYEHIVFEDGRWILRFSSHKVVFVSYLVFLHLYFLFFTAVLIRWGIKAKMKRQKKEAVILTVTLFISSLFSSTESIYLSGIFKYNSSGLSFTMFIFFAAGLCFIILKYHFLYLSPELTGKNVLTTMDQVIIILDNKLKIRYINKKTENFLQESRSKLNCKDLSAIIGNYEKLGGEMVKLLNGEIPSFSCRDYFGNPDQKDFLVDFKSLVIKDEFDDIIGVLVTGTEVKGIQLLKWKYSITQRETEIIEQLITGASNAEMSQLFGITENTIKRHISNIYNKLIVRNRVELLYMLKDYNFVSEHSTKRTLLFGNNN